MADQVTISGVNIDKFSALLNEYIQKFPVAPTVHPYTLSEAQQVLKTNGCNIPYFNFDGWADTSYIIDAVETGTKLVFEKETMVNE